MRGASAPAAALARAVSRLPEAAALCYTTRMGTAAPDASVRLLGEIARGDRDAFARFYDLHAALVHTFALRILRERGEAEEVVQDVFVQVWRQAETLQHRAGDARGVAHHAGAEPGHRQTSF